MTHHRLISLDGMYMTVIDAKTYRDRRRQRLIDSAIRFFSFFNKNGHSALLALSLSAAHATIT